MEGLAPEGLVFNRRIKDVEYCPKMFVCLFCSGEWPMIKDHMQVHDVPYPAMPEHTGVFLLGGNGGAHS